MHVDSALQECVCEPGTCLQPNADLLPTDEAALTPHLYPAPGNKDPCHILPYYAGRELRM